MILHTIYRGETFIDQLTLTEDGSPNDFYPISVTATAEIKLPGAAGSVSLLSSTGEVDLSLRAGGIVKFTVSATKSALLALSSAASVDVILTDGTTVSIFEFKGIYKIVDQANP